MSSGSTTDPAALCAADWNRCCAPGRADALHAARIPGWRCTSLGLAVPRPAGTALRDPGAAAGGQLRRLRALPEEPFLRRIRVRLGLGRRLPPARPGLLPQGWRGALHAGARQPAAGRRRGRTRDRLAAPAATGAGKRCLVGCTCCSPTTSTARPSSGRRLDDARRRAVPLDAGPADPARPDFDDLLQRCSATSARRSSRSAAAWPRPACSFTVHEGAAIDGGACGTSSTTATR
jgi:hypothetical protein